MKWFGSAAAREPDHLVSLAGPRRLRVVLLPNIPWLPTIAANCNGEGPDQGRLLRLLAGHGVDAVIHDPLSPPFNPWGRRHPFFAGFDLVRALRVMLAERSADVVVAVFESGAVVPLLLRRALFYRKPIALWDVSAGDTWRPRRMAVNYVMPRIAGLFALTERQVQFVTQTYAMRSPATLLGYCIDEAFYHPHFAVQGEGILSVGEDGARDYATLVEACRAIDTTLVLKTRRAVAIPETSAARTRIVRERLSYRGLRDLYAQAAVVALPLTDSANPSGITTLFEAMAMGKPVVATDIGITREFVVPGETGVLVPPGDPAAMQAALADLIARPDERRRIGENARRDLEARFSMEAFALRFSSAIRCVAGIPGLHPPLPVPAAGPVTVPVAVQAAE